MTWIDDLVAAQREQLQLLRDLQADLTATCLAVHALIATHPAASALHEDMLARMDRLADVLRPEQIPRYRESISRLVQSLPGPGAP